MLTTQLYRERKLAEMKRAARRALPAKAVLEARRDAFLKQRRPRRVIGKDGALRLFYVIDGAK